MTQTEKKPVVQEDLYEFQFLSELSLSGDGQWAAYTVYKADKEDNTYHSCLWAANIKTKENRMLAGRGQAKTPVWLDDDTLLFISGRDLKKEDAKKETMVYRISLSGGEAVLQMTLPVKADKLVPLENNRYLIAAMTDERTPKAEATDYEAQEGQDYYIFEELPFWFNGKGITSRKRMALYLYDMASDELKRITPPFLDVTSFDVSPDKKRIAYSGPVYDSIRPKTSAVYEYNIQEETSARLIESDLYEANHVCFLGNTEIFYTGTTGERVGKHPRYYIYGTETKESRLLPYCDSSIGCSVGTDSRYGSSRGMAYCEEKGLLYMIQTFWGNSRIMAMSRDGSIEEVTTVPGAVFGLDLKHNVLVMTAMRDNHLSELYTVCTTNGSEEKLTGFNDMYLETHNVVTPEEIRYESKNGYIMNGYVLYPSDYIPGQAYPAVLEIHGGPKTASGSIFHHEMQCLAAKGYFVMVSNPRGSDGRSEAFADITEVFGKDDFEDLMEFTDKVLEKYPDIDASKVGICGGSYGGFMCNWMVGHTDRYAAAVSQRSISNYLTKCLYTDIGYYANRLQMGAYPWEDFHKVWSMSPLSSAAHVKTPLLLLQSDEDYRCWMGDAVQMFSAVKRQGVDARMVLFHGENHELSRSGKPENRLSRLRELVQWFEKYLK